MLIGSGAIGTGASVGSGVHHTSVKPIGVCGPRVQLPSESHRVLVDPSYSSCKYAFRQGSSSQFWWQAESESALHRQRAEVASCFPMASREQSVLS